MAGSLCPRLLVVLLLCISSGWSQISSELSQNVVEECVNKCSFQNRTDESGNEYITKCTHGCKLWNRALETSCETVCNATTDILPPKLYCVMGCNEAFNNYFQILKIKIGTPPAPALVADSLTSTSLSLEWEGQRHSNLSYLVQWHYEEISGAWQYCRNQTWGEHSIVRVNNLQPYTKYRFRVAVLLSTHHTDPIVSAASVVISTMAYGPPSSAPVELRVAAVDSNRISLSWEPGPFPNGRILSYILTISEIGPNRYSALKDLPESEKLLFYMFQSLSPSCTYTVSVAMRNAAGKGPVASVNVTTPALPIAVASKQPILILSGRHAIFQQPPDIVAEPILLFKISHRILGIGIDVDRDLLFISDSNNSIYKTSLSKGGPPLTTILTSSKITFKPLDLSVDWLNEHLYILGEVKRDELGEGSDVTRWQIVRCDFDGNYQTIAFGGLQFKPIHIEVDPYNGYLFWVLQGEVNGGLYRLDLADISNGVKHKIIPNNILKDSDLGAFTIDHTNFRILVPHLKNNTVLSVSLDGQEVVNFRANTQSPMFHSVKSLSFVNGSFYWTTGEAIFTEEFHNDVYYHNQFRLASEKEKSFNNILVALPACQPIPIAVNPPIGLQSVMGTNHAKITWQPPHLLGHQGMGAWHQWRYRLQITDFENNSTIHRSDIEKVTSYTAKDLKENTVYVIKAAAVTSSGTGPWSSEFIAKTLSSPENGINSSLLWSTNDGLLKSDLTGDNIETLVYKSDINNSHVTDISYYKDLLYLVTNDSKVFIYNITSGRLETMTGMNNVGSLAIDWIGNKLYWTSPKQQLVTRSNFTGGNREPVPIVTVGKELKIDPVEGFLYWNTGHAIECSRLNGENKIIYYPAQIFRKQVMGLTVNLKGKVLYWIIHGYEGSNLYRAPTADRLTKNSKISAELISSVSNAATLGPLCYFSDRLIWLQDDTHAIISDITGRNKAKLNSSSMTNVNTIAIVSLSLENEQKREIGNVIPEQIDQSSIIINGKHSLFNIIWLPTTIINYTVVFYDIKIEFNNQSILELITNNTHIVYTKGDVPPFSEINVSIRPYTYWGSAPTVRIFSHSPQASPSKPLRPRIFIVYENDPIRSDNVINVVLRWDIPKYPNGQIRGYQLYCWYEDGDMINTICMDVQLQFDTLEYIVEDVFRNVTYYFQVRAFTDGGIGPVTDIVSASTNDELPIPKLAISYRDSVKIIDLDLGDHNSNITGHIGRPVDFAANLREGIVYWIYDPQEIVYSKINEAGFTRLLSINGTGVSIAVDWITRMLYWSQAESLSGQHVSTIYQFDLNIYEIEGSKQFKRILYRNTQIQRLQVSPTTKSLYWLEVNHDDIGKLMTAYCNGSSIRLFFHNYPKDNNISRTNQNHHSQCNCRENPSVGRSFSLDLTRKDSFNVYWTDIWLQHISVSDLKGCQCNLVVNSSRVNSDLPAHSMTIDSKYIYWLSSSKRKLNYMLKDSLKVGDIHNLNIITGPKILAIGNKTQPYPPKRCLIPKQVPLQLKLLNSSSDSLIFELPEPIKNYGCDAYDLATPYYTIYYQPLHKSDAERTIITTFDRKFYLDNLLAFSMYKFTVQINNYYGKLLNITPVLGPPTEFKTNAKAPAPIRSLKAFILSPKHAVVEWITTSLKGSEDNVDNDIWYEVHWKTEGTLPSERFKAYDKLFPKDNTSQSNIFQAHLMKLIPSQDYRIWIQAHSNNTNEHTNSEEVSIKTYPEPNNITLISNSPYEMRVSWMPYKRKHIIHKYSLEFSDRESSHFKEVEDKAVKILNGSIEYIVRNLKPKTLYKYRLKIMYANNSHPYYWPDTTFAFETPGDHPSAPGKPIVQHLTNQVYQLHWTASEPHGSPILIYSLYGRVDIPDDAKIRIHRNTKSFERSNMSSAVKSKEDIFSRHARNANDTQFQSDIPYSSIEENPESLVSENESHSISDDWIMLYNGSDTYWIIPENKLSDVYIFKIRAQNIYGWSDFSETSEGFDFSDITKITLTTDILAIILGVIISITFSIIIVFVCVRYIKKKDKKTTFGKPLALNGTLRGPDVELATLRELPRSRGGGGMFQHSTNILYNNGLCNPPTDAEIALLPHIRRDQITLTKFLGSGAFGEVFEGKAKDLESSGSETRVAIKTLRKGATDQEKTEFLQEAQLMSNFKHEHILSMLGVCLDNDPHFIIMELMEGGDLLSYLRARRPMLYTNDSLTLHDLLSMCMDVTKGCRYLEEMHFVHRDLACRNCLVSQQVNGRIVKIGDFGLARDIYKNDYYRKEGEGLLPVRWMAVECLTDGVFSRASDVWAWAVLCWEVTALGRQPYSALPNHAVMRYVRGGGKLQRPNNCPIPLFMLLQKCWSYNPDQRPTFKYCLEVLEELISYVDEDVPLAATIDEEPQYITVVPDGACTEITAKGVTNRIYFMDENQNDECAGHTNVEDINNQDISVVSAQLQNVAIAQPPKYLELLYDSDTPTTCADGYEVPRSSIRSNASRRTLESENHIPQEDDARISNNNLSSPQSIPGDNNIIKVRVIENDIKYNGCAKPNVVFESGGENDNEMNSLQKLIPNRNSFTSLARQNSVVSHISDDEKLSQTNKGEANRLLNGNGFVKRNSRLSLNYNTESTSRTQC
ncbi:receptor protein-tyrosine kinase sevenless [Arctopsyche grandis]|uniref:receptor protein-tyrosine kinase sevenless n=1 Tax=Arctopsyche grandis TaxID=121162 RepID=UPI00406D8D05